MAPIPRTRRGRPGAALLAALMLAPAVAVSAPPGEPALAVQPATTAVMSAAALARAVPEAAGAPSVARRKTIALTFDDGPHPRYTAGVLTALRRHRVKATFCIVGNNAATYPALTRRIHREGHRLCNHTRSHADMTRLSNAAARRQIRTAQKQIRAAAGVTPAVFRFPYGASTPRVRAIVRAQGLRNLRWHIDTRDWQRPAARTITARIVGNARPGAIVLMHDGGGNRSNTVASLDATIRRLKAKGYTFVPG